jgi:hypothetical protein
MRTREIALAALALAAPVAGQQCGGAITSVSIPVDSQNNSCYPSTDNVWSVQAPPFPLSVNTGIGHIIQMPPPTGLDIACLHQTGPSVYVAPYTPDPTRAVVTFQFDVPVVVGQLEIVQHTNGTTLVEGYVGNSLASLNSIGAVFGPKGDITGLLLFTEAESNVFQFANSVPGTFFQFIIRKTSNVDGYAMYRAYPRTPSGEYLQPAASAPALPSVGNVSGLVASSAGSLAVTGNCLASISAAQVGGVPVGITSQSATALAVAVGQSEPGAFELALFSPQGNVSVPDAVKRYPALALQSTGLGGTATVKISNGIAGVAIVAYAASALPPGLIVLPDVWGSLQLDVAGPYVIISAYGIAPSGELTLAYPLPSDVALTGQTIHLQAWCQQGFFGPGVTYSFTNAAAVAF